MRAQWLSGKRSSGSHKSIRTLAVPQCVCHRNPSSMNTRILKRFTNCLRRSAFSRESATAMALSSLPRGGFVRICRVRLQRAAARERSDSSIHLFAGHRSEYWCWFSCGDFTCMCELADLTTSAMQFESGSALSALDREADKHGLHLDGAFPQHEQIMFYEPAWTRYRAQTGLNIGEAGTLQISALCSPDFLTGWHRCEKVVEAFTEGR